MNIKATTLVEAAGGGFSETFYFVEPSLDAAIAKMETYLPVRLKVLAAGDAEGGEGKIVGYRLSDTANPRHFVAASKDLTGTFKGDQQPSGSDMPWTGILLSLQTTNNTRRSFTLRGVPDAAIKNTYKGVQFGALFDKMLQNYRRHLATEEYYVQAIESNAGNPLKAIAAVTPQANGLRVDFVAAHGLDNGDMIRFNRVRSTPALTGQHAVVVVDADSVVLPTINLGNLNFLSGWARKVIYRYDRIANVTAVRKASRKAGRPFFLLHGRR